MSLKLGEWKMNDNGVEGALLIDNADPNSGEISGRVGGQGALSHS